MITTVACGRAITLHPARRARATSDLDEQSIQPVFSVFFVSFVFEIR